MKRLCYYCKHRHVEYRKGEWVHTDTGLAACGTVATPEPMYFLIPPPSSDSDTHLCSEHQVPLIYERGGEDMPTIHGRWYCPVCSDMLMEALDKTGSKNVG